MTGSQHVEPPESGDVVETGDAALSSAFEQLLDYLRDVRGFDFTGYKRASLTRRAQHQMQRVGIADFEQYHDYLQVHPEECGAFERRRRWGSTC